MTIETKENAQGKVSAYYVDGQRVNKKDVELLIQDAAREDKIIEVDYYTAQQFRAITHTLLNSNLKVVLKNVYEETLMSKAAAIELGATIVKRFTGSPFRFEIYRVEMPTTTPANVGDYAVTVEAQDAAVEAEIEAMKIAREARIAAGQKEIADYIKACDEETAKKYEKEIEFWLAMSTPQVTVEAQDAAIDAEIKLATVNTESTTEETAPVDDFEVKLAELQANVDAARIDYDAKTAELDRLQAAVEDAKVEESIAWSKYFRLKDALSEFVRAKAKELCDTLIDDTILKAGKFQFITDSGSLVEEFCSQIAIAFFNGKFRIAGWQNKLAHYDTPAQVTAAINILKDAIERGEKEFKFPTVEQLKLQHAKDAFRKLYRYNELHHIIASNGQHMWYSFSQRISSKARDIILKEYGITVDEFLVAEKIVEAEWDAKLDAKYRLRDQAEFLWDKIQRDRKPLDDDNVADLLPSVDVLNDVQIDAPPAPYKPQCTWNNPHDFTTPGNLNFDPNDRLRACEDTVDDRLIRAMRHNLLKVQAACKSHDLDAALNELKLFAICRDAHKVELEEEFTPTPKRDRQKPDTVDYEQIEAKAIKYDDTVKALDKQIETIEDECSFNQVCYDEPDDSRERIHFDAELKKLIDKGLRLIKKRDTLKIHRDRLYLTIEKLDAQAI